MDTVTINRATVEQALEALVVYSIKAEHKRTHADNCQAEEAITALRQALAEPAQQQEPVAWVDLLKEAEKIVRGKVLWKRFIDGTPLANDIAVWMADFAQQHTSPPASKPLFTQTDVQEAILAEREACAKVCDRLAALIPLNGSHHALQIEAITDCAAAIRARGEQK